MGINFPASDDVFTEPSAPASTALASAGDSSRTATVNHADLGSAVVALQVEATLLTHTHDGTTRNGPKLAQANTHQSPDTDSSTTALHHTIGTGANQGAAGNHTHGAPDVWPVGSVFITELAGNPNPTFGLAGTWVQITGQFIVAAGSTFTGGTTGGSATHTHTPSFSTTGAHSHTSPGVDAGGDHVHSNAGSGTANFSHTHGTTGSNSSSDTAHGSGAGGSAMTNASHSHTTQSSNNTSHSHGVNNTNGVGNHGHVLSGTDSQGDHTHTAGLTTDSHIPPYLSVNVWNRTA